MSNETPDPLLLSDRAAAALLGISRAHLHRLRVAGKLPAPQKLGRRCLWRADELRRWVDAGCPSSDVWTAMESQARRLRVV